MKKRAVLQFADFAAPYEGNFLKSLQSLECKLSEKQIPMVYLFVPASVTQPWACKYQAEGKNIYFLSGNFFSDIRLVRYIMKRHHIGMIHAHFANTKEMTILNIARFFSKKTILLRHIHNTYRKNCNYFKEMVKKCLNTACYDIGCGMSITQGLLDSGFNKKKVMCITNGVDFQRLESYEELGREVFGVEKDAKIALMFGYDYHIKGVDLALEAMDIIRREQKAYLLISVAQSKKDSIIQKINEKFGQIPDWLRILEPRNDVSTYYRVADVFISASREEGLCYALYEAAYVGKILVASDIPGHAKLPGMFRFMSEDSHDLAEKLKSAFALTDEQKMDIAKREKEFVMKNVNIDRWVKEMYDFYMKLLETE